MSTPRRTDLTLASTPLLKAGLLLAALGVVVLGGCDSSGGRKHAYRLNPTPELDTQAQRRDDIDNQLTLTNDTNLRILNEDVGRFWLLDRPSRMSKLPSTY
jgi:ABC-type uncharacterized transport system auxiliary subunit